MTQKESDHKITLVEAFNQGIFLPSLTPNLTPTNVHNCLHCFTSTNTSSTSQALECPSWLNG